MVPDTGEEVGVLVRSGTYEVDLRKRQVRPCYWPSSRHRVLRGTWFAEKGGEWVPLREALADQLEQAYVSKIWAPSKGLLKETSALAPQDKFAPAVHAARLELNTVVDSGLYSLFVNEDEAYLMRTSSFAWLRRLGASSAAAPTKMRLRRGYAQPATQAALQKEADLSAELLDNAAETAPPTSLLLIVHGIGQTLESRITASGKGYGASCVCSRSGDCRCRELRRSITVFGTVAPSTDRRHISSRSAIFPWRWDLAT